MKKIILLLLLLPCLAVFSQKKMPSVALHYSFTDFQTAMKIKATSLNQVLKNGQWSNLTAMDAGYGISYWQGLTKNIDLTAALNYSQSVFTFPTGAYATTEKLVTAEVAGVFKLLAENKTAVTPYISAGAGLYSNAGKTGLYAPVSAGAHANLWNEAFVFSSVSYRMAFARTDNPSLFYSIGLGTHLIRKKEKRPIPVEPPPVIAAEKMPVTKNVFIWVKDEATGQPLPETEVMISSTGGKIYSGKTDVDGKLDLPNIVKDDYVVSGQLNGVTSESKRLESAMFENNENAISLILLHNDPRFTLVGKAVDKKGGHPVSDVEASINNTTKAGIQTVKTAANGLFKAQLEPASDFSISGKKAGYFSNIEQVSTKGLNRSATLYVKLELEIQEAKKGQQMVLNKIFFETNKALLNTAASTDLKRLVKYLQDNPTAKLEIQGHTDNTGSAALNNHLSKNRALSVMNYLISEGISSTRLSANGYGSSLPLDTNNTPAGRANNRRVEIKILEVM